MRRSMGMRSSRTSFPARVSSYRSTSRTNGPNCILSEGMFIARANLRYFKASRRFLFAVPTDNLQALSIVSRNVRAAKYSTLGVEPTRPPRKIWRTNEIPHLPVALGACTGSFVNVDSPCQFLQRFHHQWNLCLYPPRNDLHPGRTYP